MSLFNIGFIYIINMRTTLFYIIYVFITSIIYPQMIEKKSSINADKVLLQRHIDILGSDLFEGRGTGTKGGELAAAYIAEQFKEIGLKPIGENNSYFQKIPFHGTNIVDKSKLTLINSNDSLHLEIGKDYLLSNLGEQTIIPQGIELVFVGYGIIAPEFDHNDYLNKDIVGKIVVILNGEPYSEEYTYFNGDEPTIYSHIDVKHRIAISRGAAGTIIIPAESKDNTKYWERLVSDYSFEDVKLSYNASNSFSIILNPTKVNSIFNFHSSDSVLEYANKINKFSLMFEGQFIVRDFKASNIVGMIKGNRPEEDDEYLIVSAHYDHLGIGPSINGDKIYNGVMDNAMGVSALLEAARILNGYKEYLNRSIIFIATTGEEKGLLGSSYYVDHPIYPIHKTVANVNIDGVAFIDEFKAIVGVGSELSNLDLYLRRISNQFDISVRKIPKEFYSNEAFNRSDQIAFAKAGIPSILILDSPEYVNIDRDSAIEKIIYYNEVVYHSPFDDLSIKINYNAVAQHTNIISAFIFKISLEKNEISWNKNVSYNFARLQAIAEER